MRVTLVAAALGALVSANSNGQRQRPDQVAEHAVELADACMLQMLKKPLEMPPT